MSKKIIKYISLKSGCGLSTKSPEQILREEGSNNVEFVRNATADEVDWIRAMGGYVPEGRIASKGEA